MLRAQLATPPISGQIPPTFVAKGLRIPFPPGTKVDYTAESWALYVNHPLNKSWIAYALPNGTKIVPMGGVRRVTFDMSRLNSFVSQRQAAGCSDCD